LSNEPAAQRRRLVVFDARNFDSKGSLYVGNFGDGEIYKITFDENGCVKENKLFAKDAEQLISTDGMMFDKNDNLYVADFCMNAVAMITPDGKVERIAQSPDSDGLNGELDQPAEAIVIGEKIIVSCFDLVTDSRVVNTKHELPSTIAEIDLVVS